MTKAHILRYHVGHPKPHESNEAKQYTAMFARVFDEGKIESFKLDQTKKEFLIKMKEDQEDHMIDLVVAWHYKTRHFSHSTIPPIKHVNYSIGWFSGDAIYEGLYPKGVIPNEDGFFIFSIEGSFPVQPKQ